MEAPLPLPDRILAVLAFEPGRWVCDRCIREKLGTVDLLDVPRAVAELYAQRAVRLMRGFCGSCRETDHVVTLGVAA
jgi:hypothetical protein